MSLASLTTCFSSVDHRVVSHWAIKTPNWSIIYIATVLWSSFAVSMNIILILELLFFQHESCQVQSSCGGWYRRRHARILCWILRRIIFKTSNDGLGSLIILTPFLLKMRNYLVFCFVCYCMLFDMVKYSSVWLVFDDCIGHHNSPITHLCMWKVIGFLNTQEGSNAKIGWQGKPACLRLNTGSIVLMGLIMIMSKLRKCRTA